MNDGAARTGHSARAQSPRGRDARQQDPRQQDPRGRGSREQGPRERIRGLGGRAAAATLAAAASVAVAGAGWPASAGQVAVLPSLASVAAARALPGAPAPALVPRAGAAAATRPPAVRRLAPAVLLVVSATGLPARATRAVARMRGVTATQVVDAARVGVNGRYVAVLGVDPAGFRRFSAAPTARDGAFWNAVASGDVGVSYTMGRQDRLPVGARVLVAGRQVETLTVGGLGTVGIAGVDAVVSRAVAASLGFPSGNAMVVSAPPARVAALAARIKAAMPRSAVVEQLLASPSRARPGQPGAAGSAVPGLLTSLQTRVMLRAALSRVGMPYVWGAAGPTSFDCSGLVQWSFARAGVVMPRVAADQARTGPAAPLSRLQPGDLLFYHTDPTAPGYISHVAIYLGNGWMIQAPQPGMNVEVVPADFGGEFAGAVAVSPAQAERAAASPVG